MIAREKNTKPFRRAGAALVAGAFVAAACSVTPTGEVLNLKFDNASVGAPAPLTNSGTGIVTSSFVGPGTVTAVASISGQGNRADFPDADAPFQVIKVDNDPATNIDYLNPGAADFEFGADINLDASNTGTADNGNNVIQRGRADADSSQFKLEIDAGGVASCAVRDSLTAPADTVIATTPANTIVPGVDYRVRCERIGDSITVSATDLAAGTTVSSPPATGTIGTLDFTPTAATNFFEPPLSVGGKLNNSGTLAASNSDQFNGTIDNAVLIIG